MKSVITLEIKYSSDASTLIDINEMLAGDLPEDRWDTALEVLNTVIERYQNFCEPPDFLEDTLQELRGGLNMRRYWGSHPLEKDDALRYAVQKHEEDKGDFIVVDRQMKTTICVCSSDLYLSADQKAHAIAYALNKQYTLPIDSKSEQK
jgi:hypothetical protein